MFKRSIHKEVIAAVILFLASPSFAQTIDKTAKLYGVTIDGVDNLDEIVTSLKKLSKMPTTRIVFHDKLTASAYQTAVKRISEVSFVMGDILDSYYMSRYSFDDFTGRVSQYLDMFEKGVDIWEIGNEVNGGWLGHSDSVIAKITYAYKLIEEKNKLTALTFYYNKDCLENEENEMFKWINKNISSDMKKGLDYVFVSYYEDDCNGSIPDWQQIFDSLHTIFPNSKLGIGECGTRVKSNKAIYIKRYYSMQVNTPKFVGGYFWWYFKQDCVPHTTKLWKVLNEAIKSPE